MWAASPPLNRRSGRGSLLRRPARPDPAVSGCRIPASRVAVEHHPRLWRVRRTGLDERIEFTGAGKVGPLSDYATVLFASAAKPATEPGSSSPPPSTT
jgi:hypothetical protein